MTKKTILVILLQALLIIALFWVLIFLGKDEFETYQNEQEEEIESLNRVSTTDGINIVSLSPATQQNSGIQTIKINSASFNGTIKSFGNVVSIDSLTEAKSRYLNLKTEVMLAKSGSTHNLKQYQRLKTLNADDKNVSDQAVQAAQANVQADNAKITSNELQLKNLISNTKLQWGEALATLAFADTVFEKKLPPHLAHLLSNKNVLIQISLPLSTGTPKAGDSVSVTPLNETVAPIQAIYVSPATQSDSNGFGKTFYYSAPADLLRIGMRVNVLTAAASSDTASGVVIPNNAVVWYAGKAWAYFKYNQDSKNGQDKVQDKNQDKQMVQFIRKPISTNTEVDSGNSSGWFNQGINEDSVVVISGAQLLLSEEFKYLIKNENED
jgi:hypothetical protein